MSKGIRTAIFVVLIVFIAFMIKLIVSPGKSIDISKIETIKKPEGVVDIKLKSEGNSHHVGITVEGIDKDIAKQKVEEIIEKVDNEKDNIIVEIYDNNGTVIALGSVTMGNNIINWQ